jgi:hypothetical protein
MTNKNDSVKPLRIRIDQQKLDSASPRTLPALFEVGVLDDGVIVITQVIGPMKVSSLAATERRSE